MRILDPVLFLLLVGASDLPPVQPGRWDITSTVVDIALPGAPGFLLRMARGKARNSHKCVSGDQAKTGVAALLATDPKAQCRIDSLRIGGGRYAQSLSCPQKKGEPLRVIREGSYDAGGFAGHAEITGNSPKGALHIALQQRAVHVAGSCSA